VTRKLFVVSAIFIFSFQAVVAGAADPDAVVLKAAEEKIQRLEAEVKDLNGKLSRLERMAQQKIVVLEDEVRYLKGVLENVRNQVGYDEVRPLTGR